MPLISVVIPLYNKESCILDTVNSVLTQSFKDFELLVIDDGSTDTSIASISHIDDNRLKIISKSNGGVSSARNEGVIQSSSEFILFLDADDYLLKDALMGLSNLIKKYPKSDIFTTNFIIDDIHRGTKLSFCKCKYEKIITNNYKGYWKKEFCVRMGNSIFRKQPLIEAGLFDIKMSYFEDLDLNLRLFRNCEVVYSPMTAFVYNKENSMLSLGPSNLKKTFAYWMDMGVQNFWHRLILAMNLHSTIKYSSNDNENAAVLKKKYKKNTFIVMLSRILAKIH